MKIEGQFSATVSLLINLYKNSFTTVWSDYWTAKVKSHQSYSHLKGLINVLMCIKFEEVTTYGFLDDQVNV